MTPGRVVFILLLTAALAAGVYWGAGLLQGEPPPETRGTIEQETPVEWRGGSYLPRKRLFTLLVMGVDVREQDAADAAMFARNGGQADFLLLLAVDPGSRTVYPVHIDRDVMAEITVTTITGKPSGTRTAQICLSYGFGTTPAQSCQLTRQAVSGLLLGERVDHYLSFSMSGIGRINDAAGGATVLVEDDLTALDPALAPGATVTLLGGQAESFVRSRIGVGSGTNAERMVRQRVYLDALRQAVSEGLASGGERYLEGLLSAIDETAEKDVSDEWLLGQLLSLSEYTWEEIAVIPGRYGAGADGFTEYYPDQEALEELVMRLYYKKVDSNAEPNNGEG